MRHTENGTVIHAHYEKLRVDGIRHASKEG